MISQFKSRRALKKLRKKRLQKKNANIRRQLNKHRNSPKRRIMVTGDGMTIVPPKPDPRPIDQDDNGFNRKVRNI
jgi:hypothetical protein|tara:strand:+ start:789 stop:1013 length:225 start_codon:yes stop_codon:yes gene_type:complete